jgi:hypothetical protein
MVLFVGARALGVPYRSLADLDRLVAAMEQVVKRGL